MVRLRERVRVRPRMKARVAMPERDLGWEGRYCFS